MDDLALCRLLFASMAAILDASAQAAAAAPAVVAAQAAAAVAEMIEICVDRTTLSTAGHQDADPTEASALREFTRFCEADSAGRCKLVLHYFYKRPKMGMAVRTLLKARETRWRSADRAFLRNQRRRDAQAAAAEVLDGDEDAAMHHAAAAAAMIVDAGALQSLMDDDAPVLALENGEAVMQFLPAICDGVIRDDEATTVAWSPSPPSPSSSFASPSSSSSATASVGKDLSSADSADGCVVM